MKALLEFITAQLSNYLNRPIKILKCKQVFGGDINQSFHLETNFDSFFIKLNNDNFKDLFGKEFKGLQLLYQTKTIKIPEPILHGNFEHKIFLVTEFIEKGNPSKKFWQTFAQQLANMHKHSNERFGLSTNNYIGSLTQQNNFCDTWNEFYATQRILPLVQIAFNQNKFSNADLLLAEKLCNRLYNFLLNEKPSLIHGDLWSGNFRCNKDGLPVIYDPAIYYGNREMDIAMTLLFGGFDRSFYTYYDEAFPLTPGWQQRIELCQLYPLLVHLILFGGHYYNSVISIMKKYS